MKERPRISAIAAIGKNRELGTNNQLIWKFDADFARMKELIRNHPLIMGRKTYESVGRELSSPSIVITSNAEYQSPYQNCKHTHVVSSLAAALALANNIEQASLNEDKEIFIFGGGQVYDEALPQTERLYLTEIDAENKAADSFFPEYEEFSRTLEDTLVEENGINFRLLTLER